MKQDIRKIFQNAIISIEHGMEDLGNDKLRYNSGVRNIFSGMLLLYKYYISTFDPNLIYVNKKWVLVKDGKYELHKTNGRNTINIKQIKEVFEIIGKEEYFDRLLINGEFQSLDKYETNTLQIFLKYFEVLKEILDSESQDLKENAKDKEQIDKIVFNDKKRLNELKKILDKYNGIRFETTLEKLKGKYELQKYVINIICCILKLKKCKEDYKYLQEYSAVLEEKYSINTIFDKVQKIRNDIEHFYYNDSIEVLVELIYFFKLIIWDFLQNYIKENPSEVFSPETIELFKNNEEIRDKIIQENSDELIKYINQNNVGFLLDYITEEEMECPECTNLLSLNKGNHKLLCLECNSKWDYSIFLEKIKENRLEVSFINAYQDGSINDEIDIHELELKCWKCKDSLIVTNDESLFCKKCNIKMELLDFLEKIDTIDTCERCGQYFYSLDTCGICNNCFEYITYEKE